MKVSVDNANRIPTRVSFGEEIVELGKERPEIFVVDCDIAKSCGTTRFSKELSAQHVNVGIAEQNGAGVAAGLATTGKIPFVVTYAVFGSLRMAEQIRQSICYPNLNVKIACSHGGLTPGNDGGSHQAIEDMGTMRGLPGMSVVMPADHHSARKLVRAAADWVGPMFLRFTRDAMPTIYGPDEEFEIGKAKVLSEGEDVAIIANGDTLRLAIEAAGILQREDVSVRVTDMHTVKPLDRDEVLRAMKTGRIITVEDHTILTGLGAAVSQVVAEVGGARVRQVGIQDRFGQSATYEELLELNGITVDGIVTAARELLA
ncbi:transketolase family protein [Schaalia sp. 19OD2882]|uniref:transketolase family protein n=1 Tax=Schaalia sp. 19OD2882 TaxID=2794089 RepID=UPI001C1EEA8F|nr:transketolase C-terminal domain-containing protein [Schaalia sp. 19OD2882]QWW18706.1 transketolase family protein [Schaalia sp. 19OD2882]